MKTMAFRLVQGQDLKQSLEQVCLERHLDAVCVLSGVGSVTQVNLRLADGKTTRLWLGNREIVSLMGTLAQGQGHLHIALSDEEGNVIGGHLMEGTLIHTTAEIILGILDDTHFERAWDEQTGYDELLITEGKQSL